MKRILLGTQRNMAARTTSEITVEGRTLGVSNLDKVLYPRTGFTKGDVVDFYRRIAPVLVPHLRDRPLTLKRYPNGVDGASFYEKNCPEHRPPWVKTVPVWSERNEREMPYCTVDGAATLVWTANLAAIELHPSLATAKHLDRPTTMVFDLDPGPPADVLDAARVALWLRDVIGQSGLRGVVKTSGKKGLQLYVPLNTSATFEDTKAFARTVALRLEAEHPEHVLSVMKRNLRGGKVFVDWSQNDRHKTTVSVYSLRAEPEPTVSTPVTWEEVEQAVSTKQPARLRFTPPQVLQRVAELGDLFAPVLTWKQQLRATPNTSPLKEYATKRNFDVTPEPPPRDVAPVAGDHPTYMIHKHHASRLHYDLRLEIDGALASWAVPKGPSFDPGVKRLAVRTEDHPLEYGDFEGRIPEGQYGAGDSFIWDRGLYDTLPPGHASEQRKDGHLDLVFVGEKLKGHFHLVRTRVDRAGKEQWILFRAKDDPTASGTPDVVRARPESVKSGRRVTRGPETAKVLRGAHPTPESLLERVFPPMLATLRRDVPEPASEWILELKYDGYRAVSALAGGEVAMWTRNRLDLIGRFPHLASALMKLVVGEAVLDGEIVSLDERGAPRFEQMGQGSEHLYLFDLLWLDGRDLRSEPIEMRRELLESLLAGAPDTLHPSERVLGDWRERLRDAGRRGFEGLVAKKTGSVYQNRRATSWIKLKVLQGQELAVVGYTLQIDHPDQLGALLLGVARQGVLHYAGKVGTGFTEKVRAQLLGMLRPDAISQTAVRGAPRLRKAIWVEPKRVAQVRFTGWTNDEKLRHPVFLGLREDKKPEECTREEVVESARTRRRND